MKNFGKIILAVITLFTLNHATAQDGTKYVDAGAAFGSGAVSPVISFHKNWELGKNKKFVVGTGLRYTGYFGTDINLTSAPNELAIEPSSVDTLFAPKPSISSLNLLINLGYNINDKIQVGFNIDAFGLSFGPTGSPSYIRNGVSSATSASPTSPNILLVGNNDKGSLNSHFYGKYRINDKFGVKLAYQFLFNELTTETVVQTSPIQNDRFRVKSGQVYAGISYHF